jgi:hypothetical protein
MVVKSFRGQLAGDDAGDSTRILLSTNTGMIGYRINKLQIMQKSPGTTHCEGLVIVWKTKPTAAQVATKTFDLSNNRIIGVAFWSGQSSAQTYSEDMTIIIDNEVFNSDIYVSYIDVSTNNDAMNYYIELEQVSLDLDESTVVTLKDMRNR